MDKQYELSGQSIGSCGCGIQIDCSCWDHETPKGTCDSFVAYHIESGQIQAVALSNLTIVRLIQEANQASILYIDDRATHEQRDLLAKVFTGELGGVLAEINAVLPACQSLKVFPIQYTLEQGVVDLWIGGVRIQHNRRSKFFQFSN